ALSAVLGEEPPVGNAAQRALYHLGEAAIPALLEVVVASSLEVARHRAAWTLCWLAEHPAALAGLVAVLGSPDPEVRAAAICAQRDHGGPAAIPALERIRREDVGVSSDCDRLADLAEEALRAIRAREAGDVGEEGAPDAPDVDDYESPAALPMDPADGVAPQPGDELARLRATLLATWRDPDPEDRDPVEEAAAELSFLGPPGLAVLIAIARDRTLASDNRAAALDWLGISGDAAVALPPLLAVLRDPTDTLAHRAAWALGALGSPAAIPDLIGAFADDDPFPATE